MFDSAVYAALESRVRALGPESRRQWGRMSAHEAVCHMSDAFRMALGEKPVSTRPLPLLPIARFVALRLPLRWPRGIATVPEIEQGCGGTTPMEFERDRMQLLGLMSRFCSSVVALEGANHPIFGRMTVSQWGIWGYRHLDHHLRQFGL